MRHKKIIAFFILVLICGFIVITNTAVWAVDDTSPLGMLQATSLGAASGQERSLPTIIGDIIKVFLSILGIVAIIIIIYAGYSYMVSQGDKDKAAKATKAITQATIGLAIILSAYALTDFIITNLITATTGEAPNIN